MWRLDVKLVLVAALGASVWAAWPRGEAVAEPPARLPDELAAPAELPAWMGVATCASMACHHANESRGKKGSEYSTWAGFDKHAQAYQVLFNDRSRAMVRNLYGDSKDVKPAQEQTLCLKCHATGEGDVKAKGPRFQLTDGVGCESCHGPAEKWLGKHYQTQYKSNPAELGMWPTKNLAERAKLCAGCHVGDAATGKEVNHDLYAAGHPRLNFEFSSYLAQYPKHWDIKDDKARYPDYEERVWALGQVTCAKAALELLRGRANKAPWPEFAEYDCFACHKDLRTNSPRQQAGYGGRLPGSLPWGTWTWATATRFAKQTDAKFDQKQWDELRKEMERPRPNPAKVSESVDALLKSIAGWRQQVEKGPLKLEALRLFEVRLLREDEPRAEALTWDEATQLYLALKALQRSPSPSFNRAMSDFRKELINAFQLPGMPGQAVESPANFEPAKLKEPLRLLLANLGDK
jgi:Cytochrome c554 and c-prime